jgi:hypothetical protein
MSDESYHHLAAYTLTHGDAAFIHQLVVDTQMAQTATATSKPIGVAFALAGLYLHLERGFTGRQVQLAHMKMARTRRAWPTFLLPASRGTITAADVMQHPEGPARDTAIEAWCADVWQAYHASRDAVIAFVREHAVVP